MTVLGLGKVFSSASLRTMERQRRLPKAIKLNSKNIDAHINLGELFFKLGNLKGSSEKVKVLLDINENNAKALSFTR